MNSCIATDNYSSGWGGVLLWAANNSCVNKTSKATIEHCTFTNNKARYLGGALSNEAVMEIKNTTIKNNIAMAGGGIATFPFSLELTESAGKNACGLTLGINNTIENNTAYASGDFTPYKYQDVNTEGTATQDGIADVKTYNGDSTIADDAVISTTITYTGSGGGVWCYMNKDAWTCSLNIGEGNNIITNNSNNVGGGIYVHKKAGETTELSISGAKISENEAINGGGVAVKDANVTILSGEINLNKASTNGGGIYVDNGYCDVSGTGSVSNNEASNGGGIYIVSGSLKILGGIISNNLAKDANGNNTVDKIITNETAFNRASGVGGGIYVLEGIFTMEGKSVGIYDNLADFAADDAYASGNGTELKLPDVVNMNLSGTSQSAQGWFIDYVSNDTNYTSEKVPFLFTNNGRYRTTGNADKITGEIDGNYFYCLTLGRVPSLTITQIIDSNKIPDNDFVFYITGPNEIKIYVIIPADSFSLNEEGKMEARTTITELVTGIYNVIEITDWSYDYIYESSMAVTDDNASNINDGIQFTLTSNGEITVFVNSNTDSEWLSDSRSCENWWGGTDAMVISR